jgi:hypothetical protein
MPVEVRSSEGLGRTWLRQHDLGSRHEALCVELGALSPGSCPVGSTRNYERHDSGGPKGMKNMFGEARLGTEV